MVIDKNWSSSLFPCLTLTEFIVASSLLDSDVQTFLGATHLNALQQDPVKTMYKNHLLVFLGIH